jgi:hypothetical protein
MLITSNTEITGLSSAPVAVQLTIEEWIVSQLSTDHAFRLLNDVTGEAVTIEPVARRWQNLPFAELIQVPAVQS